MPSQAGNKPTRARAIIACTECHRRRKKCSLEQPCRSCARRYPPAECVYLPAPPLKRRSGSGRAAKGDAFPSTSKTGVKEEASVHSPSDDESPIIHQHPVKRPPLLVDNAAWSLMGDSLQGDSDLSCSTPSTDYEDVEKVDWKTITYSKHKSELTSGSDREHTPPHGALHGVRQKMPKSSNATSLPISFGVGCLDLLAQVGVESTMKNVQLFKTYLEYCAPWLWSLDGNADDWAPDDLKNTWLQIGITSPILLYVSLAWAVMRQYTLQANALKKKPDAQTLVRQSMECMAMKGKSLALLNARLKSVKDFNAVDDEVICSVTSFLNFEWGSGLEGGVQHILPHIKALREMLRQRGGTRKIGIGSYTSKILVMTHYTLAAVLECEPFMFPEDLLHDQIDLTHKPINRTFDSPLYMLDGHFTDETATRGLHQITAHILDDMKHLFDEIRSFNFGDRSKAERKHLLSTAQTVRDRICSLPSANKPDHPTANDFIYETCRVSALIYLEAVTTFTPISQVSKADLLDMLFEAIRQVPLFRWKPMSGVWLWIVLSINPETEDQWPGPQIKNLIQRSPYHVFTWDWQTYVNIMETHLCVQRWIRRLTKGNVPLPVSSRRRNSSAGP